MKENKIICVACPRGCRITVVGDDKKIKSIKGFSCPRGEDYAKEEFLNPTRILPTTVKVKNGNFPLVSVKTEKPIPKKDLLPAMDVIARTEVEAPVSCGDIIIKNILDTGVNVIATRNVELCI